MSSGVDLPNIGEQLTFENAKETQTYLCDIANELEGNYYRFPSPKVQLTDDLEVVYPSIRFVGKPTLDFLGQLSISDSWAGSVNAMHKAVIGRQGMHEQVTGHGFTFSYAARLGNERYDLGRTVVVGKGHETGLVKVAVEVPARTDGGVRGAFERSRRIAEANTKWAIEHPTTAGLPTLGKGRR